MISPRARSLAAPWPLAVRLGSPGSVAQSPASVRDKAASVTGAVTCASVASAPTGTGSPAVASSVGSGVSPASAWFNRQRGQKPSGAFAGSLAPQFGQRFSSDIDGSFGRGEPPTLPENWHLR